MKVVVTGSAGFIGNFVALRLLERGDEVIGIDNLNPYYDVDLKLSRLDRLLPNPAYTDYRVDICDASALDEIFARHQPRRVVHLAAQAGVRYSMEQPESYVASNLDGFLKMLEACRNHPVEHLVFASSSSVYGANETLPFSEHQLVDHPKSLYAATKKANELMAHSYSHLFDLPVTGLRFFTVYGPWGRPDMALFKFIRAMLDGQPIDVHNQGHMRRDFTYIDDIVEGTLRVLDRAPTIDAGWRADQPDPASSGIAPYRIYNIGNNAPQLLSRYIQVLEDCLGIEAEKRMIPMQPGEVIDSWADVEELARETGYRPATPVEQGVKRFVEWYAEFYQISLPPRGKNNLNG